MFRASVLPISKDLIKEADSLFYYFIWNGKDKVKRNVMISEVKKGGLNYNAGYLFYGSYQTSDMHEEIFGRL